MQEILSGAGSVIIYFIIAASIAILCRFLIKIPDELFRKILHCILLGSLLAFVFGFDTWWYSALTAIVFAIVVYPILAILEKFKSYSQMTTERKKGELKTSLLLVFGMFATVIAICWGWLGDRYLVLASIYAWGFGDAAAALVGKQFGKHKINWKYIDGKKSMEGSVAMFLTSFVSVLVVLVCRGQAGTREGGIVLLGAAEADIVAGPDIVGCVIVSLLTALVSTLAELYSKDGMDTVICPLSAMAVLLPLVYFFGGLV